MIWTKKAEKAVERVPFLSVGECGERWRRRLPSKVPTRCR